MNSAWIGVWTVDLDLGIGKDVDICVYACKYYDAVVVFGVRWDGMGLIA